MVAKTLGVPMGLIKIKATNVVTGNNAGPTAGNVTIELLTKVCNIMYSMYAAKV